VAQVKPLDAVPTYVHKHQLASHLVLTKVPSDAALDARAELYQSGMADCDLAIMLFDAADAKSVAYLAAVQPLIPSSVACVYVANKADLLQPGAGSDALRAAAQLCATYSLSDSPDRVSLLPPTGATPDQLRVWTQKIDHWFSVLLTTALVPPKGSHPITAAQRTLEDRRRVQRMVGRVSLVAGVAALVVGVGFYAWSAWRGSAGAKKVEPKGGAGAVRASA